MIGKRKVDLGEKEKGSGNSSNENKGEKENTGRSKSFECSEVPPGNDGKYEGKDARNREDRGCRIEEKKAIPYKEISSRIKEYKKKAEDQELSEVESEEEEHSIKEWKTEGSYGPVEILRENMRALGWRHERGWRFMRQNGGSIDLLHGEDGLFLHLVREDLREMVWHTSPPLRQREEFAGVADQGVDYEETMRAFRAKKSKKNKFGERRIEVEDEGYYEHKMSKDDRINFRVMVTGSMTTGHRMRVGAAGLRSAGICIFCKKVGREDLRHVYWECECFKKEREELFKKYEPSEIEKLPNCMLLCGIIPAMKEIREFFAKMEPLGEEGFEERWPPNEVPGDLSEDEEGFGKCAGDGALPGGGQGKIELKRGGFGGYYGPGHAYNYRDPLEGQSQTAARTEARSALRWVAWAWCRQVYITDNASVVHVFNALLKGNKLKVKKNRDIWRRIKSAVDAKGRGNFKCVKVKSHQTEEMIANETVQEKKMRMMNEEADKEAVKAAAMHAPSPELMMRYKAHVTKCTEVQRTMIRVLARRSQMYKELADQYKCQGSQLAERRIREAIEERPELSPTSETQKEEDRRERLRRVIKCVSDGNSAFPGHWWEPRAVGGDFLMTRKGRDLKKPGKIHHDNWKYGYGKFEAIYWYWNNLRGRQVGDDDDVPLEREGHPGSKCTSWITLTLDFFYSTGMWMSKEEGDSFDLKVRAFANATFSVVKELGGGRIRSVHYCTDLSSLFRPKTRGVQGRAEILNPVKVNRALKEIAIQIMGMEKPSLQARFNLPTMGRPIWQVGLPGGYTRVNRRVMGKTKGVSRIQSGTGRIGHEEEGPEICHKLNLLALS